MKILQLIAHPDLTLTSFTGQLARRFYAGAEAAGHRISSHNIFDPGFEPQQMKPAILNADHLNFAWPCMWEMPPARLVDFFQTIFVKDFAFELIDGKMTPIIHKQVTCLISMGQTKVLNTSNLSEAMSYCGLYPVFHIYGNVGPRLSAEDAEGHLAHAQQAGFTL